MKKFNNKFKNQKGVGLLETVLAVAVISVAVAYMTNRHFTDREVLTDRAMGQYMNIASDGLEKYITSQQSNILKGTIPATDGTCASNICTISIGVNSGLNNYLPDNFLSRSPWYRSPTQGTLVVKARVSGAVPYQVIQGFIFAVPVMPKYVGTDSQATHLSAVVSKGGLNIGAIYSGNSDVVGSNGSWEVNLSSLYGTSLPVTTIVARTGDGMPQAEDFLRLDGTNAMTGSLNMGGTKSVTSDMNNVNAIGATGITNAPNVQYSGYTVTGNVNLGAGNGTTQGLNFVQDQTNIPLGGIKADANLGGTGFLGPNFVLGSKFINTNLAMDGTAPTWYLPAMYTDSVGHLKITNWNQWGDLNIDMNQYGANAAAVAGDSVVLGITKVQNLIFNTNTSGTSKMQIVGSDTNFIGTSPNSVTNLTKNMLVYSGGTAVSGKFVSAKTISAGVVSVDNINDTTWGPSPVDVTLNNGWRFEAANFTKNVQFVPENIAEGQDCTSFVSASGAIASNGIGAILFCKNNVWVTGWHQ